MKNTTLKNNLCPICENICRLSAHKEWDKPIKKWAVQCSNDNCILHHSAIWYKTPDEAVEGWNKEVVEGQTITIELDDETDALIRSNAADLGISAEQYISELVLNQFIQWIKIVNNKNSL